MRERGNKRQNWIKGLRGDRGKIDVEMEKEKWKRKRKYCGGERKAWMDIPYFLNGMTCGLVVWNSKMQTQQRLKNALEEADVVVCVSAVADFRFSYGKYFN